MHETMDCLHVKKASSYGMPCHTDFWDPICAMGNITMSQAVNDLTLKAKNMKYEESM